MRDKPNSCYTSGCSLAITCRCGHHLDMHPEDGHCTVVENEKLCECPGFRSKGTGFVLDVGDPRTAKLSICLEAPGKEELNFPIDGVGAKGIIPPNELERRKRDYPEIEESRFLKVGSPIVGRSGSLVNSWLLPKVGVNRIDVHVMNVLRCLPPPNRKGESYPTGEERRDAELKCRQWDRIQEFDPKSIVETIHPASLLREVTPLPLVLKDMEKAVSFSRQGFKSLLLMGGKAAEAILGYGENCFHANTAIWMGDGTWKRIYKVRPGEIVKSFKDGEIVEKKVLEVSKNIVPNTEWVSVVVDGAYRGNQARGNYDGGVVCTPNHEWFSPDGKIRAGSLKTGDRILIPAWGNTDLIFGCSLGDAHVDTFGHIKIGHTNEEYTRAKAKCFDKEVKSYIVGGGFKPGITSWQFSVRVGNEWRERFYPNGKKIWLPPTSSAQIAVWYMDDGSKRRKGYSLNSGRYHVASIACQAFDSQKEEITEWAKGRYFSGSVNKFGNLSFSTGASKRFFREVAPWIHPSMEYKLPPEYRGQYNGWMDRGHILTGKVISVAPRVITNHRRQKNTQYCLSVEDTHCFFTRGGLVSNSTRWRGHYEVLTNGVKEWYDSIIERLTKKSGKGKKRSGKGKGKKIEDAVRGVVDDPLDTPSEVPRKIRRRRKKSGKEN